MVLLLRIKAYDLVNLFQPFCNKNCRKTDRQTQVNYMLQKQNKKGSEQVWYGYQSSLHQFLQNFKIPNFKFFYLMKQHLVFMR